jgi:predicted PurR-regulated permease PerM
LAWGTIQVEGFVSSKICSLIATIGLIPQTLIPPLWYISPMDRDLMQDFRKNFDLVRVVLILLIITLGIYLLGIFAQFLNQFFDIFIILIVAWLLSFVLEPIVERAMLRLKVGRVYATGIVYALLVVLLAIFILSFVPALTAQIQTLTTTLPLYLQTSPPFVANWGKGAIGQLNNSFILVPSLAQFIFSTFIILIFSFYFLVDREMINNELFNLTPKSWHKRIEFIQKVINETFVSFLRVQLFYGLSTAVVTGIVMAFLNLQFAAVIALVAGIFGLIPLVGPFLAIIPPLLAALLIDPVKALIIGIILLIIQQFTFNVIGPRLLGKAFRLHPTVILLSFLIGLKVAGSVGAIFAIPILGICSVMIRRFAPNYLPKK